MDFLLDYVDALLGLGDARVGRTGSRSRILQMRKNDLWETVYGAGGCIFPFYRKPRDFIINI